MKFMIFFKNVMLLAAALLVAEQRGHQHDEKACPASSNAETVSEGHAMLQRADGQVQHKVLDRGPFFDYLFSQPVKAKVIYYRGKSFGRYSDSCSNVTWPELDVEGPLFGVHVNMSLECTAAQQYWKIYSRDVWPTWELPDEMAATNASWLTNNPELYPHGCFLGVKKPSAIQRVMYNKEGTKGDLNGYGYPMCKLVTNPSTTTTTTSDSRMVKWLHVGFGKCMAESKRSMDLGWAPCTCNAEQVGQCDTMGGCSGGIEQCKAECLAHRKCAAINYANESCFLFKKLPMQEPYTTVNSKNISSICSVKHISSSLELNMRLG